MARTRKTEEAAAQQAAPEQPEEQNEEQQEVALVDQSAREANKGLNLWQKIAYVMANAHRVKKTGWNDYHKYHYVTEADLTDHLRPLMAEAGLILLFTLAEDDRRVSKNERNNNVETTTVKMHYTIVDIDTGEKHEFTLKAEGQDNQDKGYYKAYTGGNKYALLKTFQISTGDDPEQTQAVDRQAAGGRAAPRDRGRGRGDSRSSDRDSGGYRQGGPDPAGGAPTPEQQAARDRARAEQQRRREEAQRAAAEGAPPPQGAEGEPVQRQPTEEGRAAPENVPVSDTTRKRLDDLTGDERVPKDKRVAALAYMARHVSDLSEANAQALIARMQVHLPPSEQP
jgi:hypothetical protein